MTGDWKVFENELPEPYRVRGDFDGNGVEDEVWLVINTSGSGWRLIALMNGRSSEITLVSAAEGDVQHVGIQKLWPGEYRTACGKGYWECSADEPPLLYLKNPAFRFLYFEKASTIYFWDDSKGGFREIAESD